MISQTAPVSVPKVGAHPAARKETVLTTEQLVKIYGGRAVVDGVNMNVRASEIVGLLGPNGAGKTTSFYMIVGLVRPNSGLPTIRCTNARGLAWDICRRKNRSFGG